MSIDYINQYFNEVNTIASSLDRNKILEFINVLYNCKQVGGRLFVLGVGGSAANASHAVNDFRKICNIETYSISENVAELTARVNDEGWNTCFSEWLKTSKLSNNDVLLVFSVGGGSTSTSQNIVEALAYGKEIGSKIISVVSRDGGYTKTVSDVCILIPVVCDKRITPHAEEWQGIILHLVVNYIAYEY
jgi:D-sedoheptulose 7-phosphate isomerase